jgi:hypothetical protein
MPDEENTQPAQPTARTIVPPQHEAQGNLSGVAQLQLKAVGAMHVTPYEAVASVAPPDIRSSIVSAELIFNDLQESVLYTCAHDDQPIGPRTGVKDVPETTLKALANYALEKRHRERERFWWIFGIVFTAVVGVAAGKWLL